MLRSGSQGRNINIHDKGMFTNDVNHLGEGGLHKR